jgi:hypothetical protein
MPENVKLRPEEERLRALLRRCDALGFACDAVEREQWAYPDARARTLQALQEMKAEAEESFKRYRSEVGIPPA